MDLTTATPAEIDAAWAKVSEKLAAAQARREFARKHNMATWEAADALVAAAIAEMQPFTREWNYRHGWTRAYLVAGGHVHRDTNCRTLRFDTRVSWLPEVSGLPEVEIVELAGERACTVCYPSAPVDVLRRACRLWSAQETADAEAMAARAQELAAKAAAKAAKAITNPDGSKVRGYFGVVATERSAEIEAVDLLHSHLAYGYKWTDEYASAFDRLTVALAHKRGLAVSDVSAAVKAKAEKKAAKTKREMEAMAR